mgnify:CR=1 FL=1
MPDRIYTAQDLNDRRGFRAQLRVVAVPWKGSYKAHIREYYPNAQRVLTPGRGVAFSLDMLDDVVYALQLMQQERDAGKLEVADERQEGSVQTADEER